VDRPVGLVLALTVAVASGGVAVSTVPDPGPRAALALRADAATDALTLRHRGGDPLDVEAVDLRVRVAGRPLSHQPPTPFFAARGFRSGPTGPLNPASDPRWTPGERARFRLAATNAPRLDPGDRVTVTVLVDGERVSRASARAR
jgi:hypothetical protein